MREKSSSRVFESPAKLPRTNSSKAAASPSSARQNSAACFNPRASRGRSRSPYFAESSFSSRPLVSAIQAGEVPAFFSSALAIGMAAAKRITANRNVLFIGV